MEALDRLRRGLRRLGIEALLSDPVFSVTVSTHPRRPIFDDVPFGLECVSLLKDVCRRRGAFLHAYCLMPDHASLLLGVGSREALAPPVMAWKALCGQARRQRGSWAPFWERGFAERPVTGPDAVRAAARYVVEKPVRAGLVRDARDYPLCGPRDS